MATDKGTRLGQEQSDPSQSAAVIAYKYGQDDEEEERVTSGGFSSKRLTRVRDVLSRHLDAGYVPGAVAVVARHGEVHIEALGNLAFEGEGSRTPMADHALMPAAGSAPCRRRQTCSAQFTPRTAGCWVVGQFHVKRQAHRAERGYI
jgi:hypothetical protein